MIEEQPRLILPETKCPEPAAVMHAEEIVPLAERARRTFLGSGAQNLATIQQQPTPAIWR